ncbi:glycerate kinase [Crocosphaera sp.]|uniref:glycerate kinase n=1 Tax=Crocosphaera sp. TaxID=2729996 RepID=UPI003F203A82|nr:glycerate kinase [Crocosphaera sp.]
MLGSIQLLEKFNQSSSLSSSEIETLLQEDLKDSSFCSAFDINVKNGIKKIENRLTLWEKSYKLVDKYCQKLSFNSLDIMSLLWKLWLPLAIQLSEKKNQQKTPLIQGFLGVQGTGKTTLCNILCIILKQLEYTSITLSIDDFYKTYSERQKLKEIDPRFIWRGPPGTHDVELAINTLNQLKDPRYLQPISVPRFDKSLWNGQGDRIKPDIINKSDIILFEGWFLGVQPIKKTKFNDAPLPIKTQEDRQFAQDVNEKLKAYLPLWEKLDRLIILYPEDYHLSKQWRKQAEQKMISSGQTGMKNQEIEAFVNYFWIALHPQLFITPLTQNSNLVNLVITIDGHHRPQHIQKFIAG